MNKLITFVKESYTEMTQNVTWSSYSELQESSILVLVASILFAGLIGLIDLLFRNGLDFVYAIQF